MAQFSYSDYQNTIKAAQDRSSGVKVGWFKLADDGDEAVARLDIGSLDDLQFATIHQLGASANWMKISCLNEINSFSTTCPLCKAVADGNTSIGKASKRVYVRMLVSYKDRATGQWSAVVPVVLDRPAGFSREIANLARDYGDLRNILVKITRNGKKGDMKTTYSFIPAPPVFKQEMIPADFSVFNGFRLDKHSFWVKTIEEVETYLQTGSFPEVTKTTAAVESQPSYSAPEQTAQAYAQPVSQPIYTTAQTSTAPTYVAPSVTTPGIEPAPVVNNTTTAAPSTKRFSF